jgi:hypothetical protein
MISLDLVAFSVLLGGNIRITESGQAAVPGLFSAAPFNTLGLSSTGEITTQLSVPPEFGLANAGYSFFYVFVDVTIISGPNAGPAAFRNDVAHPAVVEATITQIPPDNVLYTGLPSAGAVPLCVETPPPPPGPPVLVPFCAGPPEVDAWLIHVSHALLVRLTDFTATVGDGEVNIRWTTGAEVDNEGFNVLRSEAEDGPYAAINTALIPARAVSPGGASYEFVDDTADSGKTYFYKLEDVDTKGVKTLHGPVKATAPERNAVSQSASSEPSSSSGFGCGLIKPGGNTRPPSSGEIASTLALLFSPAIWLLIRRLRKQKLARSHA